MINTVSYSIFTLNIHENIFATWILEYNEIKYSNNGNDKKKEDVKEIRRMNIEQRHSYYL